LTVAWARAERLPRPRAPESRRNATTAPATRPPRPRAPGLWPAPRCARPRAPVPARHRRRFPAGQSGI